MTDPNQKAWKTAGYIATIVIVLTIPLSLLLNRNSGEKVEATPLFSGGKSCIECHQKEYQLWKGSDHDMAMAIASDTSVVGDFNNATFSYNGKTSKFSKRSGKFYVFTEGVGGQMQEFQITHTFGIRPLQQYLIPFEKGKYQCLPIAWNTTTKKWFHMAGMVYQPEDLKPDNWLYWTNQAQNWNSMCAECHSTNLQKNYNTETKSYNTTWSDINVNCEACHGPGSAHIEWAQLPEMGRPQDVNAGLLVKTSKTTSRQLVESCAPCHARRASFGPYDHTQNEFLSYAAPQLPTRPIYHIDGQFKEENYEYGSFTQSKMYMKDVRCSDCHDPHSLKRKFEGNALCSQCHKAEEYDTPNHHMHRLKGDLGNSFYNKRGEKVEVGAGALCRDCHMPGQYYMGVDKRYDHSFRIPRPDLSISIGTPNACVNCHDDKTNEWALQWVNKWYGENKKPHYGTVFSDAYALKNGTDADLVRIINSNLYPEIIRATAIVLLSAYQNQAAFETVQRALNDHDPLIRHTAAQNFRTTDSTLLFSKLSPLLSDPIKSIRMEAANRLMTYKRGSFSDVQYASYTKALDEYQKSLEYIADFQTGRHNLGNYYSRLGNLTKAEENFREAITIDNLFTPSKMNLAMIYYQQGKMREAETIFKDLITNHPDLIDGYYYLALLYSENQNYPEAIRLLETAITKPDCYSRVYYNLGLLYQMSGQLEKSESTFNNGLKLSPGDFDMLYALFAFHMKQGNKAKATPYIEQLKSLYPNDRQVQDWYANFMRM